VALRSVVKIKIVSTHTTWRRWRWIEAYEGGRRGGYGPRADAASAKPGIPAAAQRALRIDSQSHRRAASIA
jgi:hypothetical protein